MEYQKKTHRKADKKPELKGHLTPKELNGFGSESIKPKAFSECVWKFLLDKKLE